MIAYANLLAHGCMISLYLDTFFLPVMHYVCDDGGEEAEQHDRRAGIHDRVQKLPRVRGERQHLLQILGHKERERPS